jgi:hypothetical protein
VNLRPADTWALVVGIEEYPDLAPEWRLHGPGMDAIRFANWLIERGVPTDHVLLCLSAKDPDALTAQLTQPIAARGADRTTIMSALDEVARWQGDLLFVFWGGHGSLDAHQDAERRRLFFSNARNDNPATLSYDGLKMMLGRKRPKGRIPRQAFLIDACSTFNARSQFPVDVEPDSPPRAPEQDASVRQFQFIGSRRGEAALDLAAERTGAFSHQLLQALAAAPATEWPPDLVTIARTVQTAFDGREISGRRTQTPIFDGSDWDGSSLLIGSPFSIRRRTLHHLDGIVDRLSIRTETLLSLFRATCPDSPKLVDIHTLEDVIEFLLGSQPSKRSPAGEWPPEAEFAERIQRQHQVGAPEDARVTAAWAELGEFIAEIPARAVTDLRAALDAEDRGTRRYLVIELAPDSAGTMPLVVSAWLYKDGQERFSHCWTPADFEQAAAGPDRLRRVLRDASALGARHITIEFVASRAHLARSPYAVELDEFEDLGSRYPVVVRWRDRLVDPFEVRDGAWCEAAVRLFAALGARDKTRIEWLPSAIPDIPGFFNRLEAGAYGDLLMAGYVEQNFDKRHPLMLALAGGAPAVAWWTQQVDDPNARNELATLIESQRPDRLAVALHEGRRAAEPCRTVCAATVLFWDHPKRNPYAEKL